MITTHLIVDCKFSEDESLNDYPLEQFTSMYWTNSQLSQIIRNGFNSVINV